MTELLPTPEAASAWCRAARAAGRSLGFVPTMGALHDGHLSLVERALQENDCACVSIFVNPLQFDQATDLDRYPRDLEGDRALLASVGCDMVFTGTLAGFFPGELDEAGGLPAERLLDPGPSARGLEGACRTGHFEGVATIVDRLFDVVRPDRAYFGQKDYQQSLVVRDLAARRKGPEVVVCPIARERNGLARSSRNEQLAPAERELAACIHEALRAVERAWRSGAREHSELCASMLPVLAREGVELEYAEVRDPRRWDPERTPLTGEEAVALVAVRIGSVRLIDNHLLALAGDG